MLKNGNRDTEFIARNIEITNKWYYVIVWRTDRHVSYYNRLSQRIQNETEEETEARGENARRRLSQRVQNETEGEIKPIIFYL